MRIDIYTKARKAPRLTWTDWVLMVLSLVFFILALFMFVMAVVLTFDPHIEPGVDVNKAWNASWTSTFLVYAITYLTKKRLDRHLRPARPASIRITL